MITFKDEEQLLKAGFKDLQKFDNYFTFVVPNVKMRLADELVEYGDVTVKIFTNDDGYEYDEETWPEDDYEVDEYDEDYE